MRRHLALTFAFIACSFGGASAATGGFSDSICPEATQYVIALAKVQSSDPPQKVYDTVQPAVDAYSRCSRDKLSNGFREAQHYADTRAAAFAVAAARALVALGRPDDARRELLQYRPLVQQVVDWYSETETPHTAAATRSDDETPSRTSSGGRDSSANGHQGSRYRDSAKEIVAAIDAELAKITPPAAAPAH